MKKIAVIQDEKEPVAVEVLATSIRAIAASVKVLRKGPMGENALLLLISENCRKKDKHGNYGGKVRVSQSTVKTILDSIESLQSIYLR